MNDKIDEVVNKVITALNAVEQQDRSLGSYLRNILHDQYFCYNKKTVLTDIGGKVDKVLFLGAGHLIASVFDGRGDKKTIFLYGPKDFKAGLDYQRRSPSSFYVEATAGTNGVYIKFDQLAELYKKFPRTQELFASIESEFRIRQINHLVSLHRKGRDRVLEFYRVFPHLLPAGLVLTDTEISSYLLLSEGALRRLRRLLMEEGSLPDHDKKRNLRRIKKG